MKSHSLKDASCCVAVYSDGLYLDTMLARPYQKRCWQPWLTISILHSNQSRSWCDLFLGLWLWYQHAFSGCFESLHSLRADFWLCTSALWSSFHRVWLMQHVKDVEQLQTDSTCGTVLLSLLGMLGLINVSMTKVTMLHLNHPIFWGIHGTALSDRKK